MAKKLTAKKLTAAEADAYYGGMMTTGFVCFVCVSCMGPNGILLVRPEVTWHYGACDVCEQDKAVTSRDNFLQVLTSASALPQGSREPVKHGQD